MQQRRNISIKFVTKCNADNDYIERAANRLNVIERDTMVRSHVPQVSRGRLGFGPTLCYLDILLFGEHRFEFVLFEPKLARKKTKFSLFRLPDSNKSGRRPDVYERATRTPKMIPDINIKIEKSNVDGLELRIKNIPSAKLTNIAPPPTAPMAADEARILLLGSTFILVCQDTVSDRAGPATVSISRVGRT